jgi:hypothetical protein
MHKAIAVLLLAVGVALFGACAASNRAGAGRDTKTYPSDLNAVVEAATAVFVENNLDVEDRVQVSDNSYLITGYIKSALIRIGGEAARVSTLKVFIDQTDDQETTVRVETSAQETTVMASSADRRQDEAQWFFSRLDAHLGHGM